MMTSSTAPTSDFFKGQTALVTGGGSGIGRAIALELSRAGAEVCVTGRDEGKLASVQGVLKKEGRTSHTFSADLSKSPDVSGLVQHVTDHMGALDILVHSAGLVTLGLIGESSLEGFQEQLSVNLLGPYTLTKELLPLLQQRKGQIVFINSSVIHNPGPASGQYAASKHALKGFADCLRAEVNSMGVRVLSVFPGRTATPAQERIFQGEGRPYQPDRLMQPEDVSNAIVNALALPRTAELTDIQIRPMMK